MSDPIPAASTTADPEQEQQLPTNPEDRKAAAALSSLNNGDGAESGSKLPSTTDQEALGQAMSRLEIAAGQSGNNASSAAKEKKTTPQQAAAAEVKKKAAVKVAAEDVNLLVDQLDLNKIKATELLKAHDGDTKRAIRAFIAVGS